MPVPVPVPVPVPEPEPEEEKVPPAEVAWPPDALVNVPDEPLSVLVLPAMQNEADVQQLPVQCDCVRCVSPVLAS